MESGFVALAFGLLIVGIIAAIPTSWMKAAGGALILLTVLFIAVGVLQLAR